MTEDKFLELINQHRKASGLAPMQTESGKSTIVNYTYTVELSDTDKTVKDIESAELHELGDVFFDIKSGLTAKVLRVERTTKRK